VRAGETGILKNKRQERIAKRQGSTALPLFVYPGNVSKKSNGIVTQTVVPEPEPALFDRVESQALHFAQQADEEMICIVRDLNCGARE
jgi:hypothetical protein